MNHLKRGDERQKMQIKQAKEFFSVGAVVEVSVARDPLATGWLMAFRLKSVDGKEKGDVLETALGQPKVFSSLDTLFGQVAQITGRPVRHAVLGV